MILSNQVAPTAIFKFLIKAHSNDSWVSYDAEKSILTSAMSNNSVKFFLLCFHPKRFQFVIDEFLSWSVFIPFFQEGHKRAFLFSRINWEWYEARIMPRISCALLALWLVFSSFSWISSNKFECETYVFWAKTCARLLLCWFPPWRRLKSLTLVSSRFLHRVARDSLCCAPLMLQQRRALRCGVKTAQDHGQLAMPQHCVRCFDTTSHTIEYRFVCSIIRIIKATYVNYNNLW